MKVENILVVGDWVVDEYWFLVRHNSDISSHTGTVHYRIVNQPGEYVFDLCGAGHVIRILETLRGPVDKFRLYGLGAWNSADTEFLRHLLHNRNRNMTCTAAKAWYRIAPSYSDEAPPMELFTLFDDAPTIRVVRQYHQEHRGIQQTNRVDWEFEGMHDRQPVSIDAIPLPPDVDVIVVHDLAKGVVTRDLVRQLAGKYAHAKWFVRSKNENPEWLDDIADLELVVVGPELSKRHAPWGKLLVNGTVTPNALATAASLPGKRVVLLSENHEFVALIREGTDADGTRGKERQPHDDQSQCVAGASLGAVMEIIELGWTSAFFSALIHELLATEHPQAHVFRNALAEADKHGAVPIPNAIGIVRSGDRKSTSTQPTSWKREVELWSSAMSGYGIVEMAADGSDPQLHVWRASPYLPNYVICINKKQEIITEIGAALREFKNGSLRRSLSVMLEADPGSGKTFLARTLADSFGFAFIRADVSQMVHRDELFDLFDVIATQQANDPTPVLVFVDEINSLLENSHVYGAFLAPLEEGVFVRRGKLFSLKPCAWMFAGTQHADRGGNPGEKLADLTSRLTLIKQIDYRSLQLLYGLDRDETLRREAQIEQVYLAAAIIRRYYSDVRFMSYDVLKYFHDLAPDDGGAPRRVRKLVEAMQNVQYGHVTNRNCEAWKNAPARMGKGEKERMIRLAFAP